MGGGIALADSCAQKNGFAEWSVRRHRSSIASLVVDELRELVVSGDVEGAVVVWDATRGMSLTTILAFGPNRVVTTIGVDSRRSIVAYGSAGHAVACRAAGDLAPVWENPSAHGDYVRCVAVSENDGIVVSGGGDNTVHCWAITTVCAKRRPCHRCRAGGGGRGGGGGGGGGVGGGADFTAARRGFSSGPQRVTTMT